MVFGIMLLCFVPFQLSIDPEFEEFLDLHKAKSLKNAWSNDTKLGTLDNSEAAKRPEGKMLSFKKRLSVGKVKYFYNNQFIRNRFQRRKRKRGFKAKHSQRSRCKTGIFFSNFP